MPELTIEQKKQKLIELKRQKLEMLKGQQAEQAQDVSGRTDIQTPFGGIIENQLQGGPPLIPDTIKTQALPFAGATGGAMTGAAAGGPFGAILGAFLGGGLGDIGTQELQRFGKIPGEAPKGLLPSLAQAGKQGGEFAAFEAAGQGLFKVFQKLLSPFSKSILPESKGVKEIIEPRGGVLTPAKATESRTLDILDNLTENALFGGAPIRQNTLKNQKIFEGLLDDFVSKFKAGASNEEIGNLVKTGIENKTELFNAVAGNLFRKLDVAAKGAKVNIAGFKQTASELLEQSQKGLKSASTTRLLKDLLKRPDQVTFSEAQILRSDLLKVTRQSTDLLGDKAVGVAKTLSREMDNAMTSSVPQDIESIFREANEFWRTGKERFNDTLIKSIAKVDPDQVVQKVIQKNRPLALRRVKELVGPKSEAFQNIQGSFAQKVIGDSTIDGVLSGKRLETALIGKSGYGNDVLKELYPSGQSDELIKFARGLRFIQEKNPESTGRIFVQLAQAGAAASSLAFDFTGGAGVVLLAPLLIGRAFTNPKIANLIVEGIQLGSKARNTATFLARLSKVMTEEGIPNEIQENVRPEPNLMQKLAKATSGPTQTVATPFSQESPVVQNFNRVRNRLLGVK